MNAANAKITIFEDEHISVWVYPAKHIIHHQIHKFVYGQILREALTAGTKAMKQYGAYKWLSDDRQNSAVPKAELDWGNTVWFPQTKAAGWKYWAIVQPVSAIGHLNIKRVAQNPTDQGVITQLFSDPDEAMRWLESQ